MQNGPLHRLAASARVAAVAAVGAPLGGEWCSSIGVAGASLQREFPQGLEILHMPARVEKVGELGADRL